MKIDKKSNTDDLINSIEEILEEIKSNIENLENYTDYLRQDIKNREEYRQPTYTISSELNKKINELDIYEQIFKNIKDILEYNDIKLMEGNVSE